MITMSDGRLICPRCSSPMLRVHYMVDNHDVWCCPGCCVEVEMKKE